jgi:hypothetical protein
VHACTRAIFPNNVAQLVLPRPWEGAVHISKPFSVSSSEAKLWSILFVSQGALVVAWAWHIGGSHERQSLRASKPVFGSEFHVLVV